VDAETDNPANWIIADDITAYLKRISSKHILIVSDSGYSGAFARDTGVDLGSKTDTEQYIARMIEKSSRTLMTSGGNEPVSDIGGGRHSVFADAFIKGLTEINQTKVTADDVFRRYVRNRVIGRADQTPEYKGIKNSGDDGGDFVFQLARAGRTEPATSVSVPEVQLTAPSGSGFTMEDIEKKGQQVEANKAAWNEKLKEMKTAYNRVQAHDKKAVTPDLKAAAWERFISSFSEDNPYSSEDDGMRSEAEQRVGHWQAEQRKAEEKRLAMAPRPDKHPPQSPLGKGGSKGRYTDPTTGMEMVYVKGGCYQMGDSFGDGQGDEKPVHEVCVDDFYMGKYEVTNAQYRKFKSGHDSKSYEGYSLNGDNQPVVEVSWNDAKEYADWLSSKTGQIYRLPTEAEWEYAARGGINSRNYWGSSKEEACRYANVADRTAKRKWSGWTIHECEDGYEVTSPVGSFQPNSFGLYDMMGNAWEWTNDWYGKDYYSGSPRNNPTGPSSGAYRVLRGGSWNSIPVSVRASDRYGNTPDYRGGIGFRLLSTGRIRRNIRRSRMPERSVSCPDACSGTAHLLAVEKH
jgi:formylglycine-generating enzyme required for sulfatase activity